MGRLAFRELRFGRGTGRQEQIKAAETTHGVQVGDRDDPARSARAGCNRDAIGVPLSLAGARWLESQPFGVSARDPLTVAAACVAETGIRAQSPANGPEGSGFPGDCVRAAVYVNALFREESAATVPGFAEEDFGLVSSPFRLCTSGALYARR